MLGDGDGVAIGHFRYGDVVLAGRFQINMVRPDARRQRHLELWGLGDALRGQVGGPETGGI